MATSQKRSLVLARLLSGKITTEEAATSLGISARSIRRLRARFEDLGPPALTHGNAGRRPSNAVDPDLARRVVALAKDGYRGLNDTHLAEQLALREGIVLSRASVQRILRAAGIESPRRRRAPRFRSRRERRPAEGMLVQLDASKHRWLGDRGPEIQLLAAIDDATGKVLAGVFREQEDAAGYLTLLRELITGRGAPWAVYTDRHAAFWTKAGRTDSTFLDAGGRERMPTQLGRVFAELDVETIFASSPQAKGRVERLWGTLQDRLRSELRLERIRTLAAANAFLPAHLERHNARFAVAPKEPSAAWRALPSGLTVDDVCCFKYGRIVAGDNTVSHEGVIVQLPPKIRGTYAHLRVEVRHHLDGSFSVHLPRGRELARSAVPQGVPRFRPSDGRPAPPGGVTPLPRNTNVEHPWRQWRPGQFRGSFARIPPLSAGSKRTKSLSS